VDERAIVEIDRVERPETVCKSRGEILRKLTPQRVVPAELAASRDGIPVQLVEVGTDAVDRRDGSANVARDVVADARPHAPSGYALDDLRNIERAV
jgi:hypothetical protein